MMETIISWVLSTLVDALDGLISGFMQMMALDLDTFLQYFPSAALLYTIIRGVGLGLAVGISIFALMKFFAGSLTRIQDTPTTALLRCFIAIGMVFIGNYFLELLVDLFKGPYSLLLNFDPDATNKLFSNLEIDLAYVGESIVQINFAAPLMLFTLILIICLAINLFKMLLELVQRYIMVGVLVYTGPLGWCTLASSGTMGIFWKWLNMIFSQCLMMLISAWSVKMLMSILIESSVTALGKCVFALAFCQLAQKFDSYIQQIGLNPAITGANLLDEMWATGKMLKSFSGKEGGKKGSDNPLTSNTGFSGKRSFGNPGRFIRDVAAGASAGFAASRDADPKHAFWRKKNFTDAAKQAGYNAASSAGKKNFSKNAAQKAWAKAQSGDRETFDHMPQSMKNYINEVARESGQSEIAPKETPKGGFKLDPDNPNYVALDSTATKAGMFLNEGVKEDGGYVASVEGETATTSFVTGVLDRNQITQTQANYISNSVKRMEDSSLAMSIDPTSNIQNDRYSGQIWASSVQATGITSKEYQKNVEPYTPYKFTSTIDAMSKGSSEVEGAISFDRSDPGHKWSHDIGTNGRYTSGIYCEPDHPSGRSGSAYRFTIMNQEEYKNMKQEYGKQGNATLDNARPYKDRKGNIRYISFVKL